MHCDRLWTHARLATMVGRSVSVIEDGVVACLDGRIAYAGPQADAPAGLDAADVIDCGGRLVTPGLVDCHTHLVHAGHRAQEFQRRLAGEMYQSIAASGGGIVSTVNATRAATVDDLVEATLLRLDALIAEGVTTVEVKSGYGLETRTELNQLRAARRLSKVRPIDVVTTFLGAHAVPPEFQQDRDAYVDRVCTEQLPAVAGAGLANAVDAYCEGIAFTPVQITRVFDAARRHGLPVKLHADQLSDGGGAALAARYGALSADHLEYTSTEGVDALARAGTVAVLLPGAYLMLRETQRPPIEALRAREVPLAVATDANPGTSPLTSLLTAMHLAAVQFGMTVEECIFGVTREAARALGRLDTVGTLERGKWCDLAVWNVAEPAELVYWLGLPRLHARVWRGR
jgi:imidazolonepropionase